MKISFRYPPCGCAGALRQRVALAGRAAAAALVFAGTTWTGAAAAAQAAGAHASAEASQESPAGGLTLAPAAGAIDVDGVLDDAGWRGTATVVLAYEVAPGENVRAGVETRCRLAYDEARLYLGCEAADPDPAAIRAYHAARDETAGHDRILLTLDPFADGRRAYRFGVSALGVPLDAIVAQQGSSGSATTLAEDVSWDALWTAAARVTADGYTVEAAIPFRSLSFPAGAATWRYFITRERPRRATVELRTAPLNRSDQCVLCQASPLMGLGDVAGGRALLLSPTLTATRTDALAAESTRLADGAVRAELGVDGTLALTTDLTLSAAVNPDFSQVESDAAQLEANARFARFHPEQRPFFLEGADLFGTPLPVLFTRTIADPLAGVKVTGKRGGTAVAALVARDRMNQRIVAGSRSSSVASTDADVTTAAVRLRRDVGESSTVGGIATMRETAGGYHNRVAGVDALLRPVPALTVTAQTVRTWTRDPLAPPGGGEAERTHVGDGFWGRVRFAPRDWSVTVQGHSLERTARLDAGYQPSVGVRGGNASIVRRFWGTGDGWYERLALSVGTWYADEHGGPVLERGVWLGFEYAGPRQSYVNFYENTRALLRVGERALPVHSHYLEAGIRPTSALGFGLVAWAGASADFANEAPADEVYVAPSLEARIGRHLALRLGGALQALDDERGALLRESVVDARATFHFSSRARVRATVVHRRTVRDPVANPSGIAGDTRTLSYQLVYGWELNARTLIYAGFDEQRDDERASGLTPRRRTFFLKLGHAIQP